jgi:hypothetical protein
MTPPLAASSGDHVDVRNNWAVKKGAPDGFDATCRPRQSGATTCEDGSQTRCAARCHYPTEKSIL